VHEAGFIYKVLVKVGDIAHVESLSKICMLQLWNEWTQWKNPNGL